jgi:putative selenium metabolism protein SsnA
MILTNARVLTFDAANRVLDNARVEVSPDGTISSVDPALATQDRDREGAGGPVVDLHGRLLMPALINCHTHLYSSLARGIPLPGPPPKKFRDMLEQVWWRLDRALDLDDVYYSALIGLIDSAKNGVATVIDHHSSPNACPGSLDRIAEAFDTVGLRGATCYEISNRNGLHGATYAIRENIRFLERRRSPLLGAAFGLHAAFTLSRYALRRCSEAAESLKAPYHVHAAEALCDRRGIKALAAGGVLGPRTLAAHCVHINWNDIRILRTHHVNVVHNPQSNCNNQVGPIRLDELVRRSVTVGLGSDGYSPRIWDEFRTAAHIQRLRGLHPKIGYPEAYAAAFLNNREIVRRLWGWNVGRIEPGAAADLVVLDYYPPTPLTTENVLGHLLYGISNAPVDALYVNGRAIVENRQCCTVDERAIAEKAALRAQSLWRRFEAL